jgi:molybdopterin biosynthesis enzyme
VKMFRKLMTFDEAKRAISKQLKPKALGEEEISLLEGYNRILKEDIASTLDIPPFNRSTVDGYAVKAEDTFGAEENQPAKLKVCGVVNVGESPKISVAKGEAAEIVTGAPIPEGADAAVMVEGTERENDELRVYSAVTKDARSCGSFNRGRDNGTRQEVAVWKDFRHKRLQLKHGGAAKRWNPSLFGRGSRR